MISIRYATSEQADFDVFFRMHCDCEYAELPGWPTTKRAPVIKNYDMYKAEVEVEGIVFILRKEYNSENQVIVGYAVVSANQHKPEACKIEELYIDKAYQRKGFGHSAVWCIDRLAKEEGFKQLEVFSATAATDKFWTVCGFFSLDGSDVYVRRIR